ncbi:hypothetical protein WMY93_004413 [Mugilogobius chulae]|uniref:Uncharacterized protein n=1 Tax=Mugilogobius chulae TaxID=88201 RepID=A0AAW0PNL5_9GOBI
MAPREELVTAAAESPDYGPEMQPGPISRVSVCACVCVEVMDSRQLCPMGLFDWQEDLKPQVPWVMWTTPEPNLEPAQEKEEDQEDESESLCEKIESSMEPEKKVEVTTEHEVTGSVKSQVFDGRDPKTIIRFFIRAQLQR